MASHSSESSWYDATLGTMGAALAAGFGVGWLSAFPINVAGGLGALLAAAVLVGSTACKPPS